MFFDYLSTVISAAILAVAMMAYALLSERDADGVTDVRPGDLSYSKGHSVTARKPLRLTIRPAILGFMYSYALAFGVMSSVFSMAIQDSGRVELPVLLRYSWIVPGAILAVSAATGLVVACLLVRRSS